MDVISAILITAVVLIPMVIFMYNAQNATKDPNFQIGDIIMYVGTDKVIEKWQIQDVDLLEIVEVSPTAYRARYVGYEIFRTIKRDVAFLYAKNALIANNKTYNGKFEIIKGGKKDEH